MPTKVYFFDYFSFFCCYVSLLFLRKECKLESFTTLVCSFTLFRCSLELFWLFWRGVRLAYSWEWVWFLRILILSWRRSFIFCYLRTYNGVSEPRDTSVLANKYMWCNFDVNSPSISSMLPSNQSIFLSHSFQLELVLLFQLLRLVLLWGFYLLYLFLILNFSYCWWIRIVFVMEGWIFVGGLDWWVWFMNIHVQLINFISRLYLSLLFSFSFYVVPSSVFSSNWGRYYVTRPNHQPFIHL